MKQFFYTETRVLPAEQGEEAKKQEFPASFNLDMVIRTWSYEPGKLLVILNDYHTEYQDLLIPDYTEKKGQKTVPAVRKVHKEATVYSMIYMNEEDSKRFRELTEMK